MTEDESEKLRKEDYVVWVARSLSMTLAEMRHDMSDACKSELIDAIWLCLCAVHYERLKPVDPEKIVQRFRDSWEKG